MLRPNSAEMDLDIKSILLNLRGLLREDGIAFLINPLSIINACFTPEQLRQALLDLDEPARSE